MKIIKKSLSVLLSASLALFLFAGCTQKEDLNQNGQSGKQDSENMLIMATNATFPPYEFYESNKIVGIDVDIATAISEKLGMKLSIEDMEFGPIITAVQTGKADIGMAGLTVNEDRLMNVSFSNPYATGIQCIVVKQDSNIKGPEDLDGKKIAVQENTTGDIYATDDYGDKFVDRYSKGADAILALNTGKVDAIIIDSEPAKNFIVKNPGLVILETAYAVEDYAIAIAKEDEELLNKINIALSELIDDGTINEIISKYIKA